MATTPLHSSSSAAHLTTLKDGTTIPTETYNGIVRNLILIKPFFGDAPLTFLLQKCNNPQLKYPDSPDVRKMLSRFYLIKKDGSISEEVKKVVLDRLTVSEGTRSSTPLKKEVTVVTPSEQAMQAHPKKSYAQAASGKSTISTVEKKAR